MIDTMHSRQNLPADLTADLTATLDAIDLLDAARSRIWGSGITIPAGSRIAWLIVLHAGQKLEKQARQQLTGPDEAR
jgi:hypothetical protein